MKREELEAIRKRAEAATHGPWEVENNNVNGPDTGYGEMRVATLSDTARIEQNANAEFIANARQNVPALLAEVERLTNIVNKIENLVSGCWSDESVSAGEVQDILAGVEQR